MSHQIQKMVWVMLALVLGSGSWVSVKRMEAKQDVDDSVIYFKMLRSLSDLKRLTGRG